MHTPTPGSWGKKGKIPCLTSFDYLPFLKLHLLITSITLLYTYKCMYALVPRTDMWGIKGIFRIACLFFVFKQTGRVIYLMISIIQFREWSQSYLSLSKTQWQNSTTKIKVDIFKEAVCFLSRLLWIYQLAMVMPLMSRVSHYMLDKLYTMSEQQAVSCYL